jgi:2-polyprenyl-3-methyl-5-hydroxy-6-metoxy-1,4-benzoquinol methylase
MELRPRTCPVCLATEKQAVIAESNYDESKVNAFSFASRKNPEHMHFRLVHCSTCDVVYANPAPHAAMLESSYQKAEYDSSEEARCAAQTYSRHLSRFVGKLPDLKGALDIGAGDGAFLAQLLKAGFSGVVGVEPSEAPIKAAAPAVQGLIKQAVFSENAFERGAFSLVTCFQTLEHVDGPLNVCTAAYKLLKPGGVFFTVSHNYRSISAKLLGMKSPIYDIEHLQLYSPASMRRTLERAGYVKVEVFPMVNRYPLHYWMKMLPLSAKLKSRLIRIVKFIRLGYISVPLWAGNMAAIAYKKE